MSNNSKKQCQLGSWYFDKKRQKRLYVSLSGKKFEGRRAIFQQQEDELSEISSGRSARSDLALMLDICPKSVEDVKIISPSLSLSLTAWGIPSQVCDRYSRSHMTELFGWQTECILSDHGRCVLGSRNLVYSAPTSGGKTLVAEVLILLRLSWAQKRYLSGIKTESSSTSPEVKTRGFGTVLFVVPFVALAEDMWQDMNIGVRAFHGDDDGGNQLGEDVELAVCTIEKANIIVNQLIDQQREHQLLMIVIDEIHLISDSKRGFLLEVLLSKVRFVFGDSVQIVGMSATLPNLRDVATWLDAALYTTEYRPVSLQTRVCFDKKLYNPRQTDDGAEQFIIEREIPPLSKWTLTPSMTISMFGPFHDDENTKLISREIKDPDGLLALCLETVLIKNKSVIVFCATKKWCESAGTLIADTLADVRASILKFASSNIPSQTEANSINCAAVVLAELDRKEACRKLCLDLLQCQVGLCPILQRLLPHGVAYHHAGLTGDERRIIENGFRKGTIQVLCATSTLAAGVNLPAQRVIVRSPRMGSSLLSVASFRQMCGRAGRMNLDAEGEAILLVNNTTEERAIAIKLTATLSANPMISTLNNASGGGLEKALLEMIFCGKLKYNSDIDNYLHYTLLSVQKPVEDICNWRNQALTTLLSSEFVAGVKSYEDGRIGRIAIISENIGNGINIANKGNAFGEDVHMHRDFDDLYNHSSRKRKRDKDLVFYFSTTLGKATCLSGFSPEDAMVILPSLEAARKRFVLKSGLHAVFLVTPVHNNIEPNWSRYEELLSFLVKDFPDTTTVLEELAVDWAELHRYRASAPRQSSNDLRAAFYRRLYSAILLFVLAQEVPLSRVAEFAAANRGQLQQLQKDASVFCGMCCVFCKHLNWNNIASVLEAFAGRLSYGVSDEILPLVRLGPQVMPAFRARAFFRCEIRSPEDIIKAEHSVLIQVLMDSLPFDSKAPAESSSADELQQHLEVKRKICERLVTQIIKSAENRIRNLELCGAGLNEKDRHKSRPRR